MSGKPLFWSRRSHLSALEGVHVFSWGQEVAQSPSPRRLLQQPWLPDEPSSLPFSSSSELVEPLRLHPCSLHSALEPDFGGGRRNFKGFPALFSSHNLE